jgi:hypothetical protein
VTVTVQAAFPAVHLCPFKDEVDEGRATITWLQHLGADTLELHGLRAYLDSLDEWEVSHEEYTQHLADFVAGKGYAGVTVTTEWTTAGGVVKVTARG